MPSTGGSLQVPRITRSANRQGRLWARRRASGGPAPGVVADAHLGEIPDGCLAAAGGCQIHRGCAAPAIIPATVQPSGRFTPGSIWPRPAACSTRCRRGPRARAAGRSLATSAMTERRRATGCPSLRRAHPPAARERPARSAASGRETCELRISAGARLLPRETAGIVSGASVSRRSTWAAHIAVGPGLDARPLSRHQYRFSLPLRTRDAVIAESDTRLVQCFDGLIDQYPCSNRSSRRSC